MFVDGSVNYPFFQVWRPFSIGSTIYIKTGEVQLQPDAITHVNNLNK